MMVKIDSPAGMVRASRDMEILRGCMNLVAIFLALVD